MEDFSFLQRLEQRSRPAGALRTFLWRESDHTGEEYGDIHHFCNVVRLIRQPECVQAVDEQWKLRKI